MKLNREEAVTIYLLLPIKVSDIPRRERPRLDYILGTEGEPEKLQAKLDELNKRLHRELNKGGDPDV